MSSKAAILDAEDTLLLSNLDKLWYLHCNEQNNVPTPIPAYDYKSSIGLYYMTVNNKKGMNFDMNL